MTKLAVCCSHHSHRVSAALTLAGDTARFQMVRAHARRATLLLLSSVAIVGSGAACSSSSDGGEGCPRALSLNRWAAAKAFFAKPRGAESGTASGATRGAAREPPVIAGPPPWAGAAIARSAG